MNSACFLAFLTLFVGWADSFSWDIIVVSGDNRIEFYNNGTLTHTENILSAYRIYSITYDPVHYRLLFADDRIGHQKISSFDLSTRNIQSLATIKETIFLIVSYDPVTQLLFWRQRYHNIYSFSLNPGSSNKAVDGNLIVKLDHFCHDIAVDSCGGYIYWITNEELERARFDGSEREFLIYNTVHWRLSLAIDQQTQKIYWTEKDKIDDCQISIESADFNGKNRRTLYTIKNETGTGSLTVSNDFLYWHGYNQKAIWQLPKKYSLRLEAKIIFNFNRFDWYFQFIVANYTIKDQLKGNQNCKTLKILMPNESETDSKDIMLCVHGTKVSGESRCECRHGYTGERCEIYVCQNYCLQGNCSVSVEGQPKCSCNPGYSGGRCETYACHKHCMNDGVCSLNEEDAPVCQCTEAFGGERCSVSICRDYCFQGNCSVSSEGQPICSCTDGYSGERCEVNACHKHCLNNGVCFLNEEDDPVCECTANYEGERCDVATTHTGVCSDNTIQQILRDLRGEVNQVQVIKEDLQRTLRFYSDKNDNNEAKIQKCEKSIMDLENNNVGLENHQEITSKTLASYTFSEIN